MANDVTDRSTSEIGDCLALNAYWIGHSLMWNSLHPIIPPMLLLSFGEKTKNTAYGMLTFVGLLIALAVQPMSGALSDHTRSALGRRRPWIIGGALLSVGFLFGIVLAQRYWVIAVAYCLLQFSSNLAHGPAQGLLPDVVCPEKRGVASGIKNLFDMVGVIVAAVVVGRIMGGERPLLAVLIIVAVLAVGLLTTVTGVHESPTLASRFGLRRLTPMRLRAVLRIKFKGHGPYARLLVTRFAVLLGTYAVQSFALYYVRDVFQVENPARVIGRFMVVIALSVTVVACPAGVLSERLGRRGLSLIACAMTGIGMVLLALTRDLSMFWLIGSLIGLGMGIFTSVNWAWAIDLVPSSEAGKYLGLSNLATAGSAATARLMGPFIDLANAHRANAGYLMLFVLAAIGAFVAFGLTTAIPETRPPSRARGQRRRLFGRLPT